MKTNKDIFSTLYDLVVIGAGNAGMSAALLAAKNDLKVLLIEESAFVGGTSALSAGTTWIPNTYLASTVGCTDDSKQKVKKYLYTVLGDAYQEEMIDAFLTFGAEAIEEIQRDTAVKYRARALHPDYHSEEEGATLYGRALEPEAFNAKVLKKRLSLIRPPIPEFTILGGLMIERDDVFHLLNRTKSFRSFKHSFKLIIQYAFDRLKYKRGTRLVMGNALIASLLYSLDQRDVPILLNTTVYDLQFPNNESNIFNINVRLDGKEHILNSCNIILATGGINRNKTIRKKLTPNIPHQWCPGMPSHQGSIHNILSSKSIKYGSKCGLSDYFWAPVSIKERKDGTQAIFPHFILDRGKPHVIAINQDGDRFVNESTSYHLFGIEMLKQKTFPIYLVTDKVGIYNYGLGMIRPHSKLKAINKFITEGYLVNANTLEELAIKLKVNPINFQSTVLTFNSNAEQGIDPEFRRGETDYQRINGDPNYKSNPNLGPIQKAPFYAIALYPGDIGASTGIKVTPNAEVMDDQHQPIRGLYAVGNDMHSIMEGYYPGPGITLGPGLVFSWLAVKNILKQRKIN